MFSLNSVNIYIDLEVAFICAGSGILVFLIYFIVLVLLSDRIKKKFAKMLIGIVALILCAVLIGFVRKFPLFLGFIAGCQAATILALILFPEKDFYIYVLLKLIQSWNKEVPPSLGKRIDDEFK